jgi:(p)ppGpp synthase/HD superfamily hydrolase
MDWTVAAARAFVRTVHEGQVDTLGQPLLSHLDAVRERVEQMGGVEVDQVAALLHHTVTDGAVTLAELALREVPVRALTIVAALTPRPGETEDDQVRRVMDTPGAVRVLRADLAHQLHPDQMSCASPRERERTLHRCCRVLAELDKELELTFS